MAEIKAIKIYCSSCDNWFDSPMGFVEGENFHAETLGHKMVECPFCNQTIYCTNENMQIEYQEEGLLGNSKASS